MITESEIEGRFRGLGGVFLTPATTIAARLPVIRALLYDWDGVFNSGMKGESIRSSFSEPDSMGTNMLRYAIWRAHGRMPVCAIISGEYNPTARQFAMREHFHEVYTGMRNKVEALERFRARHGLECEEIAAVFDDINDLSAIAKCGLKILVRRDASPLLQEFVAHRSLCDYITAQEAGRFPVREASELLIGLLGNYAEVVESRMILDDDYAKYFVERQSIETAIFDAPAR